MNKEEMRRVAVKAGVFGVLSIALMLHRSATKHILISDAAETRVIGNNRGDSFNLLIKKSDTADQKGKLIIPLAKSVSSDNIMLEDRYADHELLIYIDGREAGFYYDNEVISGTDVVDSAVCYTENDSGSVCLSFKLNDFYVNESSLTENSTIEVEFAKPKDMYDKIVVIDPETDGSSGNDSVVSEKDVTLDVALRLRKLAEKDDENKIKFFFTHMTDADVSDEEKETVIKESCADMMIKIAASQSSDESRSGIETYYNGTFFIRDLSNVRFADIVERNCSYKTGNTALGIYECDENDTLLQNSGVPSARICVGYLTGKEDADKLANGSYRQKAAEGIYQAILDGFKEME
ncbi:MAG: N-acetylmuramoyl-L-alanine amidase [Butyrivibrio sp.]|nr:N-acetylmuramoyl-L-alanine amidase [Butyrivibrio sp.]